MSYSDDTEIPPRFAEKDQGITNWKSPKRSDHEAEKKVANLYRCSFVSMFDARKWEVMVQFNAQRERQNNPGKRKGKGDIKYRGRVGRG